MQKRQGAYRNSKDSSVMIINRQVPIRAERSVMVDGLTKVELKINP